MIASLTGVISQKAFDHIIILVNGVGYRVHVPLSTLSRLPDLNGETSLHIYTHVREDLIHLYGFLTPLEKEMFLKLVDVSGIGPKLALTILSGVAAEDLRQAIYAGDTRRLQGIKGVGKKTSERIVIELRDKIDTSTPVTIVGFPPFSEASNPTGDAISALINFGYQQREAEQAVGRVIREAGDTSLPLEDIIKNALKSII